MEQNNNIPTYTIQDVRVTPNEIDALIANITIKKSSEVFGEKARHPNNEVFLLTIKAEQYGVETEKSIPVYPNTNVPDNSKLGKFLKRYGEFKSGMQIKLEKDDNGFWDIRL